MKLLLVLLLLCGCTPPPPCTSGETRCNLETVEQCREGNWQRVEDCDGTILHRCCRVGDEFRCACGTECDK